MGSLLSVLRHVIEEVLPYETVEVVREGVVSEDLGVLCCTSHILKRWVYNRKLNPSTVFEGRRTKSVRKFRNISNTLRVGTEGVKEESTSKEEGDMTQRVRTNGKLDSGKMIRHRRDNVPTDRDLEEVGVTSDSTIILYQEESP